MAEVIAVSVATGALKPLLGKLLDALGKEYKRFKNVHGKIKSLHHELNSIHAFLLEMSKEENPDEQDKDWMKNVRELSYDMEDSFDEFKICVGDKSNPKSLIKKLKDILRCLTKAKARRDIAKAVEDLLKEVEEVAKRNARYMTANREGYQGVISKRNNEDVDNHRALALSEDASKLVGIDGPRDVLIQQLMKGDGTTPSQKHKLLCITGFGGLGKTTLAKQVYERLRLKDEMECHAYVSVSRNPDLKNILQNILCRLSNEPNHNMQLWDQPLLIEKIQEHLTNKRYLIFIDDIWDKDAWKTISKALLKNNSYSIIITTTRSQDIAETCRSSSEGGIVYNMNPLSSVDAKRLFYERLFGSQDKCPAHLVNVSDKILDKCAGVPLAIISISGLLASKAQTVDEWDRVHNSIGHGLGKYPDAQMMMQILSLSYFDLPYDLKTCMLYISVFPEDSVIDKKRLIRRWIAEGFIQEEDEGTTYASGERCFNELINRSLIQGRNINMYGEVTACQVHDTILDFITSKSEEENFVTVFDDGNRVLGKHSKIRRLSLQATSQDKVSTLAQLDLSHLRSFTMFSQYSVEPPRWSNFRFLRVLDLDGFRPMRKDHLAHIENLFQLKYLSLRGTGVCELPEQIGKLQYLETLDLENSRVQKLPYSIAAHPRLVYLDVDKEFELPDGVGSMAALEELNCVEIFKQSIDFTRELEQLKNLREAVFYLHRKRNIAASESHYQEYINNMLCSLSKLDHLKSLSCYIEYSCKEDFCLDSEGYAPRGLRRLVIGGWFILKVPNWVQDLRNLQQLTLTVKELQEADIMVLGRLWALVFLQLVAKESFHGRVTIRASDGFLNLKQFDFRFPIPVMFGVGAMPNLETLNLMFSIDSLKIDMLVVSNNGDFPFGIQHLSSLRSIRILVGWGWNEVESWISEMIIQLEKKGFSQRDNIADTIFTLINATASLLEAELRQDPSRGKTCALERVALDHGTKMRWDNALIDWKHARISPSARHVLVRISNRLSVSLQCRWPMVLARDKTTFDNIIKTMVEDTTDESSLRWIADNAHTATVSYTYPDFIGSELVPVVRDKRGRLLTYEPSTGLWRRLRSTFGPELPPAARQPDGLIPSSSNAAPYRTS